MNYRLHFLSLLSVITVYPSQKPITIVPLTEQDIPQVLSIIQGNFDSLCNLPEDIAQRQQKIEALSQRISSSLINNIPMSPVAGASVVPNTLQRFVIKDNALILGIVDYYLQNNNENGYIETLCTLSGYQQYRQMMLEHIINEMKKKNIASLHTHIFQRDTSDIQLHTMLGFIPLEQSDSEKSMKATLFKCDITKK